MFDNIMFLILSQKVLKIKMHARNYHNNVFIPLNPSSGIQTTKTKNSASKNAD